MRRSFVNGARRAVMSLPAIRCDATHHAATDDGMRGQCNMSHKIMIRLTNFLYIFNLRQGTILIAIHQISLSAFVLIFLLAGLDHVDEMLATLQTDMQDVVENPHPLATACDVIATNNQRRFANAQALATETVVWLVASTIGTALYLASCIALLIGAVYRRRRLVLPWLAVAAAGVVLLAVSAALGDDHPSLVALFGGHRLYHVSCALFLLTFIYAICAVSSFAMELSGDGSSNAGCNASRGEGERLLLLDQAAHSSLLSARQFHKLSRAHFV